MPDYIYVLAPDGKPLMPTRRTRHVRKLLNTGKARIAGHAPFTIQLKYQTDEITQPVMLGMDPGRVNIGLGAVNKDAAPVLSAVCETRNREIPKLMADRKAHRQESRRGERKARQRLAKKHNTMIKAGMRMRHLPQYGKYKYITCKGIKNTEARFCNRKRPAGWLTPTVEQLVRTHVNLVHKIGRLLPVTDIAIEVNRFAFALLEDPEISGVDFQNGPLKGFDDVNAAVNDSQHGKCLMCKKGIEHYHHIVPRSRGGSNTFDNIAGLCMSCHDKVHKNAVFAGKLADKKAGQLKKYGSLSVINQAIPYICERLIQEFGKGHVFPVPPEYTARIRTSLGFEKDRKNQMHEVDAYCIALAAMGARPDGVPEFGNTLTIKQFRRHDRSIIRAQFERTYKLDGKTVAKNRRKRTEQKDDSLAEWFEKQVKLHGLEEAERMRSNLKAVKSRRSYNNPDRMMPGAVFIHHGTRYVMDAQHCNGTRIYAYGNRKNDYAIKNCFIAARNTGLVFI